MALSVTSNFAISAGYASNNMRSSQTLMGKSINRISSGLRAPKPADDIVSYVGGTKLKADSAGYTALSTSLQDAAARLNMADSVLAEVSNSLLDLKAQSIAYQSTASATEQSAIQSAANPTITAIKAVMDSAQYKGAALFDGTQLDVWYGWGANQKLGVPDTSLNNGTTNISVADVSDLSAINTDITTITNQRATIGGNLSALEQISNYLSAAATSADAAYTAVTEVDMAKEMTAYVKNNIQSQASQAMVAQANQGLAQVLNLLQV